jgi:hypothetical protein
VQAAGSSSIGYQWQLSTDGSTSWNDLSDSAPYSGAASSSLTITGARESMDRYKYRAIVTDLSGSGQSVTSIAATLIVGPAPIITEQPTDQTVLKGETALFRVMATGTAPLRFQWQKNNADIPGANGSSYQVGNAQLSDNGNYRCVVKNIAGEAVSNNATLSVSDGGDGSGDEDDLGGCDTGFGLMALAFAGFIAPLLRKRK